MGNPMNGDIYEGQLRPGDVGLDEDTAKRLKKMIPEMRIADLQTRFREQGARAAHSGGAVRELPRYKCHKEVWALKIAEIQPITAKPRPTIAELERILNSDQESPKMEASGEIIGGYMIVPADEGFAPFEVSFEYIGRHKPEVGGYFVVYKDGYKSYSPAQAFEEGYTRL